MSSRLAGGSPTTPVATELPPRDVLDGVASASAADAEAIAHQPQLPSPSVVQREGEHAAQRR